MPAPSVDCVQQPLQSDARPHAGVRMSSDFVYRRATAQDAHCLSVLATQVFLDTYATSGINTELANEVTTVLSKQTFLDRLDSSHVELFVAELAGNLIGFVDLDSSTTCPNPSIAGLEVLRLYVQQPFHGRKVGRALISLAEDRAQRKAKGAVWLTAWVGNHHALGFYKALGYQDVGSMQYLIEAKAYENRVLAKALRSGVE